MRRVERLVNGNSNAIEMKDAHRGDVLMHESTHRCDGKPDALSQKETNKWQSKLRK
jgi:hypothetical protein